jgi:hypothetical protein
MNNSRKEGRPTRNLVKPLVFAVALSLPLSAAFAAEMGDVVKTRADQTIDQQYGRDSVYAFSLDAKPMTPERTTGSSEGGFFGKMKSYATNAWHKTEDFTAAAWGKTAGAIPHDSSAMAETQPQGYGRAGGFVGPDRIAILNSDKPYAANASLPINELGTPVEATDRHVMAPAIEPSAQNSSQVGPTGMTDEGRSSTDSTAMESDSMRATGDANDMSPR